MKLLLRRDQRPGGMMGKPTSHDEAFDELLEQNRSRHCGVLAEGRISGFAPPYMEQASTSKVPSGGFSDSTISALRAFSTCGRPGSNKATRPCRCGMGGGGKGACGKAPRCQRDYQNRISGPMFDRIDLTVETPPVTAADMALPPPSEGTAEAAARVAAARELQVERLRAAGIDPETSRDQAVNARASGETLDRFARPDEAGRALLMRAGEAGGLTARGWTRTLRLARTIADLEGCDGVLRRHIAEALIHRRATVGAQGDFDRQAGADAPIPAW